VALVPLEAPAPESAEPPTVSVTDLPSVPLRPVVAPVLAPPIAPVVATPKPDPDGIMAMVPAPKPGAASAAPPVRSAAPNCSPPYYFDELGLKIFKPDCVN